MEQIENMGLYDLLSHVYEIKPKDMVKENSQELNKKDEEIYENYRRVFEQTLNLCGASEEDIKTYLNVLDQIAYEPEY